MDITKAVEKFVKENLDESSFLHSLRVRDWALKIARQEKADLKVVELSALLHDVGKQKSSFGDHHLKSAKMADTFLKENNIGNPLRLKIISCIKTHMAPRKLIPKMVENFKEDDFPKPVSIEEKCLYDADLMELIGPVGLTKILNFCLTGYRFSLPKSIEFTQWLMGGSAEGLLIETAKEIAKPYIQFQNQFFRLYKEQQKS